MKKICCNFFQNLSTPHWDSQCVRKVNKKKKWCKYVVCNTYSQSNLGEMLVAYKIPSQENQAKEGLTPLLKLEHFPTLTHTSFKFIKKKCITKTEIN